MASLQYHHGDFTFKMTRDEIVQKYLGVPYKHHGRDLNGLDCYGLIVCIYADNGGTLSEPISEYSTTWAKENKNLFIENYHLEWVKVEKPDFLDVILIKNGDGLAFHAGVVLDGKTFIHTNRAGTSIAKLSDWKSRTEGFYRHR